GLRVLLLEAGEVIEVLCDRLHSAAFQRFQRLAVADDLEVDHAAVDRGEGEHGYQHQHDQAHDQHASLLPSDGSHCGISLRALGLMRRTAALNTRRRYWSFAGAVAPASPRL